MDCTVLLTSASWFWACAHWPWSIICWTLASSALADSSIWLSLTLGWSKNIACRPYSVSPVRASTTMAPNPLSTNSVAATDPIVARPRRPRRRSASPVCSAPTASSGETSALAGGHRKSSRQSASRTASASKLGSLGSSRSTGRRSASASRSRSVPANSSRDSGIVTRRDDFGLEPGQRPVLGHADRSRRAADGGGGLLGGQADDHAQDQDLALLGRQDLEQLVHSADRIGLDGPLLRARVERPALGHRLGGVGTVTSGGPVRVGDLVGRDAVQECQERTSPLPIAGQRRDGGQAPLLSHVVGCQATPFDCADSRAAISHENRTDGLQHLP